ncbi:MAG: molybdate ABC transporter permease subunit [Phormidesmis sp.]
MPEHLSLFNLSSLINVLSIVNLSPLWTSLKTASVATVFAVGLGVTAAYGMMGYRGKLRRWIDGLLTLPLVLPPTVVGFVLLLLLGKRSLTGKLLEQLGISIIFTWSAAVIAATVVAFPLVYKTALSAFEQVDREVIDAARTLGASKARVFWQVLLPLAWPGIVAGCVLAFARALGEFGATLMVGGSILGVTQTIPITIYFAAEAGQMNVAIAWVLTMIIISLLVIAALNYGNPHHHNSTKTNNTFHPKSVHLIRKGFNWIYFAQLNPFPAADVHTAKNPSDKSSLARFLPIPPSSSQAPQLSVNIRKQLSQFELNLQLHTGPSPLGIIGASGSGKSMTLKCIAGLATPDEGQIVLNGRVLFDAEKSINVPSCDRKVGIFFQNYALFPHLSVAQNIAFGMQQISNRQRAARVSDYLRQFGLAELGNRYPHQLSGGQQQRVALARVLASQPNVLLLDEPLSALDTYLRSSIEKLLISTLCDYNGITLFITHKLEEVYRVCPNLLVLGEGKVLATGTKEYIFEHPPTFTVAKITECKNFSRAHRLTSNCIEAIDWGCQLQVNETASHHVSYIGIRAHHIQFLKQSDLSKTANYPNLFPGWLAAISETQHRVTLYIKLHNQPTSSQDYHLQAEVYRDKWAALQATPYPWCIQLMPEKLIVMSH